MPEQDPSRFETLKQTTKEKLAIGLIGTIGLVGGAIAANEQANPEPVQAADVPEATISSLKEGCLEEGLIRPEIRAAKILHAGKYMRQINLLHAFYEPYSQVCVDAGFVRAGFSQFEGRKGGKWVSSTGYWVNIYVENAGGEAGTADLPSIHEPKNSDFYIKGKARVLIKQKVLRSGKVLAEKIFAKTAKKYK